MDNFTLPKKLTVGDIFFSPHLREERKFVGVFSSKQLAEKTRRGSGSVPSSTKRKRRVGKCA